MLANMLQAHPVAPSLAYSGPTQPRNPNHQQLPSLRTIIDLPPLQPPSETRAPREVTTPSAYASVSSHSQLQLRPADIQGVLPSPHLHSPQTTSSSASYFDSHYTRKRPASPTSFRPSTRHGTAGGIHVESPGSTTSTARSAYSDERFFSRSNRPARGSPKSTDGDESGGRQAHYKESQHFYIGDTRPTPVAGASAQHSRCLGQQHVPGRGLCYIYEDGTVCEVMVRGEPVNPEWGLTRAGRARKRLAKACNGCREKKVKCEPSGGSRCQRCSRKGQECQWSQYSESSPDRESYEVRSPESNVYPRPIQSQYDEQYTNDNVPLTPPYTVSSKNSYEPVLSVPELEARSATKRLRSGSPERLSTKHHTNNNHTQAMTNYPTRGDSGIQRHQSVLDSKPNAYQFDPIGTQALLQLYFDYRDTDVTCVLPREAYWASIRGSHRHSHDEKLLLYVVLALGSLYTTDAALKQTGIRYAQLACEAEKEVATHLSLPLALARLHLAFYHFATGNGEQSCYYIHSSFRTINALQLNVNGGIVNVPTNTAWQDFGFSRVEIVECRRRVFWLGYLTERECSFVSNIALFSVVDEDVFLHLPNNERQHNSGIERYGPYVDGGRLDLHKATTSSSGYSTTGRQPQVQHSGSTNPEVGAMALDIIVAQIWGDVQRHTYRSMHNQHPSHIPGMSQQTSPTYAAQEEAFMNSTLHRLSEWEQLLPEHLQYSQTSTWRNIRCGSFGDLKIYLSLQCFNHATRLHLARFNRWQDLPQELAKHNIRAANAAARDLLSLTSALAKSFEAGTSTLDRAFAHPFIGHAILLATDTVSSLGNVERHMRETIRTLTDAVAVVQRVAVFFATGAEQERLLRQRIALLQEFAGASVTSPAHGNVARGKNAWRCPEPCALVKMPRDCDVVYGVDESVFVEAMAGPGGWPDVRAVPGQ